METVGKIRRYRFVEGRSIKGIARDLHLSRNTVRNVLRSNVVDRKYSRRKQKRPKLGPYLDQLHKLLDEDSRRPWRERLSARRLFDELRIVGYAGSYDSIQRYVRNWRRSVQCQPKDVFIPLSFAPGEAYQFDWSYEQAELGGITQQIKVAHFRLCYSRLFFVTAYPREAQEMVFDAHIRAFKFFGGTCRRGIYDNLKTVVDKVLIGKDRKFNRRFLQLCAHYLVEPIACTPAAGWEKGQVENQVGNVRDWLFRPQPKFPSFAELNEWLSERCIEIAQTRAHPEFSDKSVWEVYQQEKSSLLALAAPFESFIEVESRVSPTSLVRFDSNRYSVYCRMVGQAVTLRVSADKVVIVHENEVVGEHGREFGRNKTIYDPWHYVPALSRKPGALRNGAPFKNWELPQALTQIRQRLEEYPDGDRQFVTILGAVTQDGLEAVEAACIEVLKMGLVSSDVVINVLARQREPQQAKEIQVADYLTLQIQPSADCCRYDRLLDKEKYGTGRIDEFDESVTPQRDESSF